MIVKTKSGDLPVRFGMNALAEFGDLTDKSMNEVMECLGDLGALKISEILAFIYVGFKDGAREKKEECKVKDIQEVGDMITEDQGLLGNVTDVFLDDATTDGEEPAGDKKKSPSTPSKP